MKKKLFSIILISLILGLEACSNEVSSSQSATIQTNEDSFSTESTSEETVTNYPSYFLELIKSYNHSADTYKLSYKTPLFTSVVNGKPNDFYSHSYNFGIQSLNDPASAVTITIYEYPEQSLPKSYEVSFDEDFNNQTLKDFITATILFTDSNADIDSANQKMKELVNSYQGSGCSQLIESGNYCIFLKSSYLLNQQTNLHVKFKDELNQNPDPSNYSEGSFEQLQSPLNADESIKITANIKSVILSNTPPDVLEVSDSEGNLFNIYFTFDDFCINFEPEREYTFYGVITKSNSLRLEYVEEISSLDD